MIYHFVSKIRIILLEQKMFVLPEVLIQMQHLEGAYALVNQEAWLF